MVHNSYFFINNDDLSLIKPESGANKSLTQPSYYCFVHENTNVLPKKNMLTSAILMVPFKGIFSETTYQISMFSHNLNEADNLTKTENRTEIS